MNFEYLEDNEKWELAQFLKRVSFATACEYSEGEGEKQKDNAYFLLNVFEKVRSELAEEGYAPR